MKGISFNESVPLREVEAHVNVHEGKTESLTFIRYSGVYCNIGFHFQHGELKQLAELLLRAHAAGEARIEADERDGEIVEVR